MPARRFWRELPSIVRATETSFQRREDQRGQELRGGLFLMSEVPLYGTTRHSRPDRYWPSYAGENSPYVAGRRQRSVLAAEQLSGELRTED